MPLDLAQWMQYLDPSQKVIDLYIPGSHDASAYEYGDVAQDAINEGAGAICQNTNYVGQLAAGSRYFDMRVTWNGQSLVMKHSFLSFERFDTVLDQLLSFTDNHETEVLFLDLDFDAKSAYIPRVPSWSFADAPIFSLPGCSAADHIVCPGRRPNRRG